jgi:hypothetical protein
MRKELGTNATMRALLEQADPFVVAHMSLHDFYWSGMELQRAAKDRLAVRFLRGERMRTYEGIHAEFAAALQFPYYFGHNWPALNECLSELEWIPADGYQLMFMDSDSIDADENGVEFGAFVRALRNAIAAFSKPVSGQGSLDRPAKYLRCAFHCGGAHRLEQALREGGQAFSVFPPAG